MRGTEHAQPPTYIQTRHSVRFKREKVGPSHGQQASPSIRKTWLGRAGVAKGGKEGGGEGVYSASAFPRSSTNVNPPTNTPASWNSVAILFFNSYAFMAMDLRRGRHIRCTRCTITMNASGRTRRVGFYRLQLGLRLHPPVLHCVLTRRCNSTSMPWHEALHVLARDALVVPQGDKQEVPGALVVLHRHVRAKSTPSCTRHRQGTVGGGVG